MGWLHQLSGLGLVPLLLFAAAPSSTNYTLKSYDIGSGGTNSSSSTNYKLNGTSAQSSTLRTSTNYGVVSGVNATMNASVPPAPTVTNPSSYYDRLKIVLNISDTASDTKYLIAISTDNFTTTNYIQTDNSVSSSQAIANYQTYTAWGGASGFLVVGLSPSTTYQVKVKALRGNFSGSAFGPTASAATVAPSLSFGLATTLTSTPPFLVGFTSIVPGTVTSGTANALISLTSNANNGGAVYTSDLNAGLVSSLSGTTITSATADLGSASSGYGAQVTAVSQTSGGPLTAVSPFNGTSDNVGAFSTAFQPILTTTAPITAGSGTVRLKAKVATTTPAASDYADTVTFVAAMNF